MKPYKNCQLSDISQGYKEEHKALDFSPYNGYGKFLVAPENVKIIRVIDSIELSENLEPLKRGYGILMQSTTNSSRYHLYWHCLPIFPVSQGDYVQEGTIVAQMGNSGTCYRNGVYAPLEERTKTKAGTHLHWEVFNEILNSRLYFNPMFCTKWSEPNYSILSQVNAWIKILNKAKL